MKNTEYTVIEHPMWDTISDRRSKKTIQWYEKWSYSIDFNTLEEAKEYLAGKYEIGGGPDGPIYNEAPTRYILRKIVTETLDELDAELKYNVDNATKEALEETA
tara:strand:- start:5270 stop:5581 length:312 start_codon:yes stop_codon:yes gene_type:complete